MTIPASQLVDITPRVIGGGLSGLAFVGMYISKNDYLPANTAVPFYNLAAVGDYFGTNAAEYVLASNYFTADTNATKKPEVLYFFRKVDGDIPAFLRGIDKVAEYKKIKAVTNGSFTITIDGETIEATALNFSGVTSYSAIATIIQTKLSSKLAGVTCTWDDIHAAFVVTSPKKGSEANITIATAGKSGTDVSDLLGLGAGATVSQGAVQMSLTDTMNACVNAKSNWFSFMPIWEETNEEAEELSSWCNSQGVRFLYAMNDAQSTGIVADNVSSLGYVLKDNIGTLPVYQNKGACGMAMGCLASIDPNTLNARKTIAFKQQSGLTANVADATQAQNLLGNGYNFYGKYATASNELNFFQNGQVTGDAKWADTYYGQVFMRDGLQNGWLNALKGANTIPYNEAGYGVLRAAAMDTINTALNAGFIRQGVSMSETQKAQVTQEAGLDISGALETQGWYLQILDPTTQVRSERGTPVISFWYMDGGSVQRIVATSTVIL